MEAKIGQPVIVYQKNSPIKIRKIEGETKTSWRVDGSLYKKNNLRSRSADSWHPLSIELADEKKLEEVRALFRRSHRLGTLTKFTKADFDLLTEEEMDSIISIIESKKE